MKAQITPQNDVTFLRKQAPDETPNANSRWQAQACLNMQNFSYYERLGICL
jgi:hypothetical protein